MSGDAERAEDALTGLRIGELSRRVGVSPDVLRAWERRYGLLRPRRSRAGQRLYTAADEQRLRRALAHVERGFSPAVAARLAATPAATADVAEAAAPAPAAGAAAAAADEPTAPAGLAIAGLSALPLELRHALDRFDDGGAQRALDRLLASFALDTVVRDVLLPYLAELGERWARGEVSVDQEHFASAVISGRLHALARSWDVGVGPRAVLACPSDERHDLGLLCFALALRQRGWRISYLGADTPADAIAAAAGRIAADLLVLSAVRPEPLAGALSALDALGTDHRTCVGGRGGDTLAAAHASVERLPSDPIHAADLVSGAPAA
jgi:MerR family transcriptional regulator, light-induced transcriptional regulator